MESLQWHALLAYQKWALFDFNDCGMDFDEVLNFVLAVVMFKYKQIW